jgi:hypothetical protein
MGGANGGDDDDDGFIDVDTGGCSCSHGAGLIPGGAGFLAGLGALALGLRRRFRRS